MTEKQLLARITADPGVMAGEPVVSGTRLAVEYLVKLLAHGATEAEMPLDSLAEVSAIYQSVKRLTLEVITRCHNPDYETTMEQARKFFSKMEEKTFQLSLFEETTASL